MTQVRFMLVSAPAGSVVRWPGGWYGPDEVAVPRSTTWCAWRLLSANNRELGRSFSTFPSSAACAEAVSVLRDSIAYAEASISAGMHTGLWHWEVSLFGTSVAISPRTFSRQRECEHNLSQFLAGAAQVQDDLAVAVGSTV